MPSYYLETLSNISFCLLKNGNMMNGAQVKDYS